MDLVPIGEGSSHLGSIEKNVVMARHVENLGYKRFWISEHHNMETLVSSATPVLIGLLPRLQRLFG